MTKDERDKIHTDKHQEAGKYAAKVAFGELAMSCSREGAIAYAKGVIQGSIAELREACGDMKAYTIVTELTDVLLRAPTENEGSKLWTPSKE